MRPHKIPMVTSRIADRSSRQLDADKVTTGLIVPPMDDRDVTIPVSAMTNLYLMSSFGDAVYAHSDEVVRIAKIAQILSAFGRLMYDLLAFGRPQCL